MPCARCGSLVVLLLGACVPAPQPGEQTAARDEAPPAPVLLEHVGGSTDAATSVAIVLVPHWWGGAARFRARARALVASTLRQDWFSAHAGELSFWLDWDPALDTSAFSCRGDIPSRAVSAAANLWRPTRERTFDFGGGVVRAPGRVVALLADDCYAFSVLGGDSAVGSAAGASALAHELAHALAGLHDEYGFDANPNGGYRGTRSCTPAPNLAHAGRQPWACLAGRCPAGEAVGTYSDALGCPGMARPCQSCQMRTVRDRLAFCPVCRAALDAALAGLLGRTSTETCNGADDDADGWADEDCGVCAPPRDTTVHEPPCTSRLDPDACATDAACGWLDPPALCLPVTTPHQNDGLLSHCVTNLDDTSCDADPADCAWYGCVGACLPGGTPLQEACDGPWGCFSSGTPASCDGRGDSLCAWYVCANACLPRGSEGVPGC
jgi:hypothetical protein